MSVIQFERLCTLFRSSVYQLPNGNPLDTPEKESTDGENKLCDVSPVEDEKEPDLDQTDGIEIEQGEDAESKIEDTQTDQSSGISKESSQNGVKIFTQNPPAAHQANFLQALSKLSALTAFPLWNANNLPIQKEQEVEIQKETNEVKSPVLILNSIANSIAGMQIFGGINSAPREENSGNITGIQNEPIDLRGKPFPSNSAMNQLPPEMKSQINFRISPNTTNQGPKIASNGFAGHKVFGRSVKRRSRIFQQMRTRINNFQINDQPIPEINSRLAGLIPAINQMNQLGNQNNQNSLINLQNNENPNNQVHISAGANQVLGANLGLQISTNNNNHNNNNNNNNVCQFGTVLAQGFTILASALQELARMTQELANQQEAARRERHKEKMAAQVQRDQKIQENQMNLIQSVLKSQAQSQTRAGTTIIFTDANGISTTLQFASQGGNQTGITISGSGALNSGLKAGSNSPNSQSNNKGKDAPNEGEQKMNLS